MSNYLVLIGLVLAKKTGVLSSDQQSGTGFRRHFPLSKMKARPGSRLGNEQPKEPTGKVATELYLENYGVLLHQVAWLVECHVTRGLCCINKSHGPQNC